MQQHPGNDDEKNQMDGQLRRPVESAEDDVVGHPHNRQPTGPVGAAEQVEPGDDRGESNQQDPSGFSARFRTNEITPVVRDTDRPGGDEQVTHQGDGQRSITHDRRRRLGEVEAVRRHRSRVLEAAKRRILPGVVDAVREWSE